MMNIGHFRRHQTSWGLAIVLIAGLTLPVRGQLFSRATVIRNARIETMSGPGLAKGDLLIKNGRIIQIADEVKLSIPDRLTATSIDARGSTITPGLIDVWSSLGRIEAAREAQPVSTVWDAFDGYDRHAIHDALANGVTTLFLTPGGPPGIQGLGVVVQLQPQQDQSIGSLLVDEAALCIDLGSGRKPVQRMSVFQEVRAKFRAAIEYRAALEDYDEDLKEYLEKLDERRKAKKKSKQDTDASSDSSSDSSSDKESQKPESESSDKSDKDSPKKDADDAPPSRIGSAETRGAMPGSFLGFKPPRGLVGDDRSRPNESRFGAFVAQGDDDEPEETDQESKGGTEEGAKKEKDRRGKKEKDEDKLKKPTRPAYNGTSELLLRVLDRKLPVRIEAHLSADLLNALALADEFHLDVLLQGATEAYLISESVLAAREELPPIILGHVTRPMLYEPQQFRRHYRQNAVVLWQQGIPLAIGSGGESGGTRFIAENAQLATLPGADRDRFRQLDWLRLLTVDAASVLRISREVGQLRRGMRADFVIWKGDPNSPTSTVDQVFVNGRLAYPASK